MPTPDENRKRAAELEKQYGLPEGMLWKVSGIESSHRGDAVGPVVKNGTGQQAKGWFQFMPATAKQYGVTDPTDFNQSAEGAAKFISELLGKNGGDTDKALAYYNGGHRAVAALEMGKPWAETKDYLAKYNGTQPPSKPPAEPINIQQPAVTSDPIVPLGNSAQEQLKSAQDSLKYDGFGNGLVGIGKGLGAGIEQTSWFGLGMEIANNLPFDPNWSPTVDELAKGLDGVPAEFHKKLLSASGSAEELAIRAKNVKNLLEKTQEAAQFGIPGYVGMFAGAMLDVDTALAVAIPTFGAAKLAHKGSRIAAGVEAGLLAGASNYAYEAATNDIKTIGTPEDKKYAALMGLYLGGTVGMFAKRMPDLPDAAAVARSASAEALAFDDLVRLHKQKESIKGFDAMLTNSGKAFKARVDKDLAGWSDKFQRAIERDTALIINRDFSSKPTTLTPAGNPPPLFIRGLKDEPARGGETDLARWYSNPRGLMKFGESRVFDYLDKFRGSNEADFLAQFSFTKDGSIKSGPLSDLNASTFKSLGITNADGLRGLYNRHKSQGATEFAVGNRMSDTTGVKSVLVEIGAKSSDPALVELAKFLHKALPEDAAFSWVNRAEWNKENKKHAGFYSPDAHRVFMPDDLKDDYSTMLHEILHSATVHKLDYGFLNPNTPIGALTTELEGMLGAARKQWKKTHGTSYKNNYYLTNSYEFTAGLFSGSKGIRSVEFIDLLKSMKVADKTMFNRLVDIVRQLFGMGAKETNALLKSYDLLGDLIDEKLDVTFKRDVDTTIHFQAANEYVDPIDAKVATEQGIGETFGFGLALENVLGGKNVPQSVRDIAGKLFGTTIGYKGHGVVTRNAWDSSVQLSQAWDVQMLKGVDVQFGMFKEAGGYKFHEEGKAWEAFQARVSDFILGVDGDYHPSVVTSGNQYIKVMGGVVDHVNNPGLHAGEVRKGLTQREYTDPETGEKLLSAPLEKNTRYMPRQGDMKKWDEIASKFGKEPIVDWFATSFRKATGADEARSKQFAKWYVDTTYNGRKNRANELVDNMLRGQDREGLKTSLMDNLGIDTFEADKILNDMFPNKESDTGALSSSLKHRNSLDEMHKETILDKDGQTFELGFNDLFDTNVFDTFRNYSRRMAGSVAIANSLGVYKSTDIDSMIATATKVKLGGNNVTEGEQVKHIEALTFAFDRILGVPQEDVSKVRKVLSMWRKFNVIRLMGGAVFNQLVEASQVVGTLGLKATLEATPELSKLRRDLVSGKAPTELLEHLENTTGGAGADFVRRMDFRSSDTWVRKFGDTKMNQRLDALDTGLSRLASGVLDKTGMTGAMVLQKRTHATALTNHFIELAHGGTNTFLSNNRLAMMGLEEVDFTNMKNAIVKYSKDAKGQFAKTKSVDFDRWQLDDPKTHADFLLAVQRESRRVVQENDLASMIPIMGSTLGQTVFQFQNFTMQAWNKSLMFGVHNADMATFSTIMYGGLFGTLTYMGRSQLNTIGMNEEQRSKFMTERMNFGQVMANGFGRISQASLLPTIYDTTIGTMTGTPLFSGMRTTSDLSSVASNPTLSAVNSLISMSKIVRNSASDEFQTTSSDIRTWGRTVLPMASIPPISTILNSVANQFPTSDKQVPD